MRRERTQPGNPNRLSVWQHIFPTASIARFAGVDGLVDAYIKEEERCVRVRPKDPLFCGYRLWDDTTERHFMKQIEDRFQTLAERLVEGNHQLDHPDHLIISHYYSLCRLRAEQLFKPQNDAVMKGYMPGENLTTDQEEKLERNGYMFMRGTALPGRQMAGIRIRALLPRLCPSETKWAVVRAVDKEFLVPDSFGPYGIVSLEPSTCLVANNPSGLISSENVVAINHLAVKESQRYYFARSLNACGIGTSAA